MQIQHFKKKYTYIIGTFLFILFLGKLAFATDTIPTQIPDLEEQVDITVSPKLPKPGELVTVSLDAYGIDLNNSIITWTSNEQNILDGKGEKVVTLNAPKEGQTIIIKVNIVAPNSKPIERTTTIKPQTIDILWEARTYTPPFYKGKAMFSPQENVKFVAIPSFVSPQSATYKWSQDGEVQGTKGGFGKNSFSYSGDILALPVDIIVEAYDATGNVGANHITIQPTNPEIYLYEKSTLYGTLFNKELSTLFDLKTKQEGTLSIYPFYYGVDSRSDKNIEYKWAINGNSINVPTYQNDLTFRNTEDVSGKSIIGINVLNTSNYFEEVQKATTINFQKTNSIFSF